MKDNIRKLIEEIDTDLDDIEFQLNQTRTTVNNLADALDNAEDDEDDEDDEEDRDGEDDLNV